MRIDDLEQALTYLGTLLLDRKQLYAAADHGADSKHFKDLQMLKPNKTEIEEAARWCVTHDV
jgi:hypothetical protein